jgi:hypothetical protein
MKTMILFLLLSCPCFSADPNILSRQFWGTTDPNYPFIVIEELSPKKYRYVSVEPNLLPSWDFTVDKARTYRLNSVAALHYVAVNCPRLAYVNTLSRFWIPVKKAVEPNTPSGYFMCYSDSGSLVYHDPNCPYTAPRKTESISESKIGEYQPCPVCRPDIKIMIKGVTDPNLREAIKEMMNKSGP